MPFGRPASAEQDDDEKKLDRAREALTQHLKNPGSVPVQDFSDAIDITPDDGDDIITTALVAGATLEQMERLFCRALDENPSKVLSQILVEAAAQGRQDVLVALQQRGHNISATTDAGRCALHAAAETGKDASLRWLLENGVSPNLRDKNGQSPLRIAVKNSDPACVTLLVLAGADLEEKGSPNERLTPLLHLANGEGAASIIPFLVNLGADVTRTDSYGNTALHEAIQRSDPDALKVLIRVGAPLNQENRAGYRPIDLLSYAQRHDIARQRQDFIAWLVEAGAEVNGGKKITEIYSPLARAILSQNEALITLFLSAGADVNQPSGPDLIPPILLAAATGQEDIVKELIARGAKIEARDKNLCTVFHAAAHANTSALHRYLLKSCPRLLSSANASGQIPLHIAFAKGNLAALTSFQKHLRSVNTRDHTGLTPLQAALFSNTDLPTELPRAYRTKKILDHKTPNEKNTALHLAACFNNHAAVSCLLNSGASAGAKNAHGNCPIHLAIAAGSSEALESLIDRAKKSRRTLDSYRDGAGRTPLHVAVIYGHLNFVQTLLNTGCQVTACDRDGNTPLHLAARLDHKDIARALHDSNAKAARVLNRKNHTPASLAQINRHKGWSFLTPDAPRERRKNA